MPRPGYTATNTWNFPPKGAYRFLGDFPHFRRIGGQMGGSIPTLPAWASTSAGNALLNRAGFTGMGGSGLGGGLGDMSSDLTNLPTTTYYNNPLYIQWPMPGVTLNSGNGLPMVPSTALVPGSMGGSSGVMQFIANNWVLLLGGFVIAKMVLGKK